MNGPATETFGYSLVLKTWAREKVKRRSYGQGVAVDTATGNRARVSDACGADRGYYWVSRLIRNAPSTEIHSFVY